MAGRGASVAGTTGRPSMAVVIFMLTGPIVWALHLTVVYLAHAILCARCMTETGIVGLSASVLVGLATAAALAAVGIATVASVRTSRRLERGPPDEERKRALFRHRVMQWLAVLSFVGIVWAGAATLILEPCGGAPGSLCERASDTSRTSIESGSMQERTR